VKEGRGVIISELPLEAPPAAEHFPTRNRIIAGMSLGVVVVEANLGSGSLITARLAGADYGREVFAMPGRVDSIASAGTHHLIKTATAHLVENAEDVMGHLGDVGRVLEKAQEAGRKTDAEAADLFEHAVESPKKPAEPLTSVQQKIVGVLKAKGSTVDEIVEASGLVPQVVMAEMTLLQIRGKVKRLPGNRYARP
jgi:DNA processing protein